MCKFSKKTKYLLGIACILIVVIIVLFIGLNAYQKYQKEQIYKALTIHFVENSVVEYGNQDITAKSFIKSTNGTIKNYPAIDVMKIGKQSLTYKIEKDGVDKEIQYEIEVKDTTKPKIEIKKSEIHIPYGESYDLKSNIKKVSDPIDGNLTFCEKEKQNGYWMNENINNKKAGKYKCQVYAKDKNGNIAETEFFVIIEEKVVVEETPIEIKEEPQQQQPSQEITPFYVNGILIVNKQHGLPSDYAPGVNATAKAALYQLQQAASNQGFSIPLLSGYRSYNYQKDLYQQYVARDGQAAADRYSARPGYSEHQSGLAFDIGSISNDYGNTPAGQWLAQHAHEFGFIIRYPQGKESITGYMYEPWHVRYLGVETAQQIYSSGLTLEEFFQIN